MNHELLPRPAGTLCTSMNDFRASLRRALGIDQGSCLDAGAPAGSCRGRIVELDLSLARVIRTRFAILLTDADYSRRKHYQIILPIRTGDGSVPAEGVLEISEREWISVFRPSPRSVLLPIPVVQSVWHAVSIVSETRFVVDNDTLAEIDRRVCDYFSLPPAEDVR